MKRPICMPSTTEKWPSSARRMRARRMARSASFWPRTPVSRSASFVTRSAANCMISTANMPPSDRPARANLPAGIWSTAQRAALSQLSQIASGARRQSGTTTSASPDSAATWPAYSRGEQIMPGTRSSGVLFIRSSRRERSLGAAAGIPMAGHGRLARHRFRSRHPARPVPRAGAVVYLHRPHPDQHRELADRAQLRLQRRHGNLRLHLGLHGGDRLRPHDAARGLGARLGANLPPRLAALCRAHPAVRGLLGPGRLGVYGPRHAGADRGDGALGPRPESVPGHPRGGAAEVPPGQSRRTAALYGPAALLPLRAAGRRALAVRRNRRLAGRLCGDMPLRLEPAGLPGKQGLVLQSHGLAGGVLRGRGLCRAGAAARLARPIPLAAFRAGRALPAVLRLYRLVLAV